MTEAAYGMATRRPLVETKCCRVTVTTRCAVLSPVNWIFRVLRTNAFAVPKSLICGITMWGIASACCGSEDESITPLQLVSPNASPGLEEFGGGLESYRRWHKEFHEILKKSKYDLEKQRPVHNSARTLRQHPFDYLPLIISNLDNQSYSLTRYFPPDVSFRDMSVADLCYSVVSSAFGEKATDFKGEDATSYLSKVIYEGEVRAGPADLKPRMTRWFEKRRNMKPWEIQYEVLKWGFDKHTRDAPAVEFPGTNTEDYYRFRCPGTKELYRRMQVVRTAKASIQFSDSNWCDLVDYMIGRYDIK